MRGHVRLKANGPPPYTRCVRKFDFVMPMEFGWKCVSEFFHVLCMHGTNFTVRAQEVNLFCNSGRDKNDLLFYYYPLSTFGILPLLLVNGITVCTWCRYCAKMGLRNERYANLPIDGFFPVLSRPKTVSAKTCGDIWNALNNIYGQNSQFHSRFSQPNTEANCLLSAEC